MHKQRLLARLTIAAFVASISGPLQAQDWHYSFGADYVQVENGGAIISSLTSSGDAPNQLGFARASIDKKSSGTFYRVRIDCMVDQWGNGQRVQLVSDWADGGNTRFAATVTCPSDTPLADLYATKVQAASQGSYFLCRFDDENFGESFVGCGSDGQW